MTSPRAILYLDSSPDTQSLFLEAFAAAGYQVVTAASLRQAALLSLKPSIQAVVMRGMKRLFHLGFLSLLSVAALAQQVTLVSKPDSPKPKTNELVLETRSKPTPKLDYYLSHGFLWASTFADERASAAYGGHDSACSEATQLFATADGRIRSGRYYAVNLGIAAPLTVGDFLIRRHYRVPWWYRLVADGSAVTVASQHSYWAAQWVSRCRTN